MWKCGIGYLTFVLTCFTVFTLPNLDKDPNVMVPPSNIYEIPKPGTMDWRFASDDQKEYTDKVLKRLTNFVRERRCNVRMFFKSFDKNNNGHMTRPQFRSALNLIEIPCTDGEIQAISSRFSNDAGVNYIAFIDIVDPEPPVPLMFIEKLKDLRAANDQPPVPEREPARSLEAVLLKVKSKVFRERVRIHEWARDYDKRRTGRMLKNHFRRALDLCNLGLQQSELFILEDHYRSSSDPDCVDYLQFIADIESVFSNHNLEKMPTVEPELFRPPHEIMLNELLSDQQQLLEKFLNRLAERVKETRVQLYPLFEDFDKRHIGAVTRSQFRRVLSVLDLAPYAPTQTEWICIWEKFCAKVGGQHDVNYMDFCDEVYHRAGFTHRVP